MNNPIGYVQVTKERIVSCIKKYYESRPKEIQKEFEKFIENNVGKKTGWLFGEIITLEKAKELWERKPENFDLSPKKWAEYRCNYYLKEIKKLEIVINDIHVHQILVNIELYSYLCKFEV
jgi:hypothetical protein